MSNIRIAMTKDVGAIVVGLVSLTSMPPVLCILKSRGITMAFTGIGPQPGQTDYTSAVTNDNFVTGQKDGSFVCALAKSHEAIPRPAIRRPTVARRSRNSRRSGEVLESGRRTSFFPSQSWT